MSRVLYNAIYSAHTAFSVDVLQTRQRDTNNYFSSPYYPVHFMSLLCRAITKPGKDTVIEHAFNGASVEQNHAWDRKIQFPQSAERVKSLIVCRVFLMTALVLSLEVNLSVRWTHRNLTLCTISTSWPLMDSGRWCRWLVFLKSTTSSFVLLLRERLRLLHHSVNCATSRLYADSSLLVMRPTTVVLSANFMIWLVLKLAEKSYVSNINNKGLSTHPCGDPVLTVIILDVVLTNHTVCCLSVKKSKIYLHMPGSAPSNNNFSISCCGKIIMNAELKSINNILA